MAKPYRDGKGWAIRMRVKGQDIYLSGFASEAAAKKAAAEKRESLARVGKPKGLGPWRTSLGQALQDYGLERLAFMQGGKHDATRINRYLRTLGLDLLKLTECPPVDPKSPLLSLNRPGRRRGSSRAGCGGMDSASTCGIAGTTAWATCCSGKPS